MKLSVTGVNPSSPKDGDRSRSVGIFVSALVVPAILLAGLTVSANVQTDVQWYSQLKAAKVFWTRRGWAITLGTFGTLLMGPSIFVNHIVARTEEETIVRKGTDQCRQQIEVHPWLTRLFVSLVLGIVFGVQLSNQWRTYVLQFHRTPFGQKDIEFDNDVSLYVFILPVLQPLLTLSTTFLAVDAAVTTVNHCLYGGTSSDGSKVVLTSRVRVHSDVLETLAALVMAGFLWLHRYNMLPANNERFSGASFTDTNASPPGITISSLVAVLIAGPFVLAVVKGLQKLMVIGIAITTVAGLVVTTTIPYFVQRFQVAPSIAEKESTFIQRNINATLTAYGLDNVKESGYRAQTNAAAGQLRSDAETTTQIRVLGPSIISSIFTQLQYNRPYYSFDRQLFMDRYTIKDTPRGTVISIRELNLSRLSKGRRTWVNDRTVYTRGFGVIPAYGDTMMSDGKPSFFQQGVPSAGEFGKYEPRIYFGKSSSDYSVVGAPKGTTPWEPDYPIGGSKNGVKSTTYADDGGPKIGNAFSKLMFAIRFHDTDPFFSDCVTKDPQIPYDRDPRVRVSKVAPYLALDSRTYPAVVDMDGSPKMPRHLVWALGGYTTANQHPYSTRQSLNEATVDARPKDVDQYEGSPEQANYIRNPVRVAVDVYDGPVEFYRWDKKDPIVNAWSKVFPGALIPMSKMSGNLMSHMRYPEDMFKVQRTFLSRYHVTSAKGFYSGGDFWDVPQESTAPKGSTEDQPPYYLTLQMPGQDKTQFSLSTGFILNRTNKQSVMAGLLAADSEAGSELSKIRRGYGQLRLVELPRDVTVPGPNRAENSFLTSSEVSTTFNLLKQGGTQVIVGSLLTLPVDGGPLYVQPVYVRASKASGNISYPIAQYVLTTLGKGGKIEFVPTLEGSLNQTFGGDSGAQAGGVNISGYKGAPSMDSNNKPKVDPSTSPSPSGSPSASLSSPSASPNRGGATPTDGPQSALSDVQKAVEESNSAMKEDNQPTYGEA